MPRNLVPALALLTGLASALCQAQNTVPATKIVPAAEAQPAAAKTQAANPVYDEQADGATQITEALAKAKKNNRRVLIQWGANWCGWCNKLAELTRTDPKIGKELNYEYDLIHVDVGQFDKHMDLAAKYGADLKGTGIPYLTVLDGDGKVIANQETGALENPAGSTPAHSVDKVMTFLTSHQAACPSASSLLADALAQAKAEGKPVFLHFGAPWCIWCHRLEDFMARDDIAPIFAENFVDLKVDTDRYPGGGDMLNDMRHSQRGGIPWFTILDADGNEVVNSSSSGDNIGYPGDAPSAEVFIGMLRKARPSLTTEQLEHIQTELVNSMKRPAGH
ncbi:MAG: thioredoxin family protein [Phycisphaerales bacterium]|nr:thioredoxin family protein [Phycisphaerales bacterium]